MGEAWRCRWCAGPEGVTVLDLGAVPAADHFPAVGDPVPDPLFPLRAVLCTACGLTQLEDDPTSADEPRGVEPAALREQARAAVADLLAAGLARPGTSVREYTSPHGGAWLGLLTGAGLRDTDGPAALVVDSLSVMHCPDQRAAFSERAAALAPGGVLAVHVHTLATILTQGTWNALRHGHYAYYGLPVLLEMAAGVGLAPLGAWTYPLYGGTTMVAFTPAAHPTPRPTGPTGDALAAAAARLERLTAAEEAAGVRDPRVVARLGADVERTTGALRDYVAARAGRRVGAYAAASRAVPLLAAAGLGPGDVIAVADASPAKWGRAMPGSRIPVVSPADLAAARPATILLFVPDLLDEARAALPDAAWAVVGSDVREVDP